MSNEKTKEFRNTLLVL